MPSIDSVLEVCYYQNLLKIFKEFFNRTDLQQINNERIKMNEK